MILSVDNEGNKLPFLVSITWESIHEHSQKVPWNRVVWFSQCIPKNAFFVWLVIGNNLKTQDRLKSWEIPTTTRKEDLRCCLCSCVQDNHAYLFFECMYSRNLWFKLRKLCNMDTISEKWSDIMQFMCLRVKKNSIWNIIGRLLLGTTAYHVWQERNMRLHNKGSRRLMRWWV